MSISLGGKDFKPQEVILNAIINRKHYGNKIFLFGKETIYTVTLDTEKSQILEMDSWSLGNLTLIDNHYLYTIMNENSEQ